MKFAPEAGYWETMVDPGDRVEAGDQIGRLHFLERPDRTPEPIHAATGGVVCDVRAIAVAEQGDNLAVIGREIDAAELA